MGSNLSKFFCVFTIIVNILLYLESCLRGDTSLLRAELYNMQNNFEAAKSLIQLSHDEQSERHLNLVGIFAGCTFLLIERNKSS